MPHPSIIRKKTLSECGEGEPVISENVITDLCLDGEFRRGTLALLRQPCSAEEIPMRQRLFALILHNGGLKKRLSDLSDDIAHFSRLVGQLTRSEIEEERVLLFLPVMRIYFDIAENWTEFAVEDNRFGEIGRYFDELLSREDIADCVKKCRDILSKRNDKVKLTVRGNQVYASEGRDMLRDRFEDMFENMGIADAIPPQKHPAPATPSVTAAYAQVYAGYYEMAKGFYTAFYDKFLQNDYDISEISRYSDEISFLLDCAQYFEKLEDNGYRLTYPAVSAERVVELDGLRDPSLLKREVSGADVVPNDVRMAELKDGERLNFFILSGANGGGKTTFLRSVGLAVLFFITGCPVVAERGKMYAFNSLYAHFPSNEAFENSGRFVNENERAMEILDSATADSFALFNETYSGTDEKKSEDYSSRLADTLWERGVFGIYVTHIHSLTGGKIPTLAAVIDENDDNRRTYRIRRVGGTKSSFAEDILKKYGLDAASLEQKTRERKDRTNA